MLVLAVLAAHCLAVEFGSREGNTFGMLDTPDSSDHVKVSVLMPTYSKTSTLLPMNLGVFQNFSRHLKGISKIEWLIADNRAAAPPSSSVMDKITSDPRIRYSQRSFHTLGQQRQWLVDQAKGDVCVFIDGDDWYGEHYVERRVAEMLARYVQRETSATR
jgi:hypothetical protein